MQRTQDSFPFISELVHADVAGSACFLTNFNSIFWGIITTQVLSCGNSIASKFQEFGRQYASLISEEQFASFASYIQKIFYNKFVDLNNFIGSINSNISRILTSATDSITALQQKYFEKVSMSQSSNVSLCKIKYTLYQLNTLTDQQSNIHEAINQWQISLFDTFINMFGPTFNCSINAFELTGSLFVCQLLKNVNVTNYCIQSVVSFCENLENYSEFWMGNKIIQFQIANTNNFTEVLFKINSNLDKFNLTKFDESTTAISKALATIDQLVENTAGCTAD